MRALTRQLRGEAIGLEGGGNERGGAAGGVCRRGRSRRGRRRAEGARCGDRLERVADLRAAGGVIEDAEGLAGLFGRQGERGAGCRGCGGGLRRGGKGRRRAQEEKNEKPGVKYFAHRV